MLKNSKATKTADSQKKASHNKDGKESKPLLQRISVTTTVTLLVLSLVVSCIGIAGYYAYDSLYKNKLTDTWAIMFLELERQVEPIRKGLQEQYVRDGRQRAASDEIIIRLLPDETFETLKGSFARPLRVEDLGLDLADISSHELTMLDIAGKKYVFLMIGRDTYSLRVVPTSYFQGFFQNISPKESSVFIVTRQGKMIYSNDQTIGPVDFVSRPLVQKFIKAPLTQGQLEFMGSDGSPYYGFFQEIKGTNLVIFSEVSTAKALYPVKAIAWKYGKLTAVIVLCAFFLIQLIMMRLTDPIRELTRIAGAIGQGYFNVRARFQGIGEISQLGDMVNTMSENLLARDNAIAKLMKDQAEKVRLESELKIAQKIQENLLPAVALSRQSGVQLSAEYIPATECAGDWYGYYYNEKADETIFVIADVSGHGAGSSMFTAILAGLFHREMDEIENGVWDLEKFVMRANKLLFDIGRRKWHASMLVARYRKKASELDLAFAGHPAPILHDPIKGVISGISGRGNVLGIDLEFKPSTTTVPFRQGMSLVLYTDGLTEVADIQGNQLGRKAIRKVIETSGKKSVNQVVEGLVHKWIEHKGDKPAVDDVCIMVVRAA